VSAYFAYAMQCCAYAYAYAFAYAYAYAILSQMCSFSLLTFSDSVLSGGLVSYDLNFFFIFLFFFLIL